MTKRYILKKIYDMLNKELLSYNSKLYWIYRKFKESHLNANKVQDLKEILLCDLVLKHNNREENIFLFLREISEAELVN